MVAVARLRLKERFAMATFAPAFGVHASHHFRPARSRQTCHAFTRTRFTKEENQPDPKKMFLR
jgi:hypothetical protein